jgi:hypothetical protein
MASVIHPQLVASLADAGHGAGMGHGEQLSLLKPSEQNSSLEPRFLRERWGLDFSMQPHQGLAV